MKVLRSLLVFLSAGALLLVLQSSRERREISVVREQLEQTLRNVVERVRSEGENVRAAVDLSDAGSLAKARSLALLIEADPSVLADQSRLDRVCRTLDTDELTVSDETGTLVASVPTDHVGFNLGSTRQAAAFLPAITNGSFELVQAPQVRSTDTNLFQYVGVARRDRPGVVQVGVGEMRRQALRRLASAGDIARTSRVRRGGSVRIESVGDGAAGSGGEGRGGGNRKGQLVLSRVCGDRRVTVSAPSPSGFLGGRATFVSLMCAAVLLFLAAVRAMVPDFRNVSRAQKRACLLFVCAMASIGLAFESVRERAVVAVAREQLLLTLENVTARVWSALENVRTTTDITRQSNLVKARSYALLAAAAPDRLTDPQWLETARRAFDADAVSVSDEKGVIVAAAPSPQKGYCLASNPASAVFMAAVTNRSFELVKGPFARGFDGKAFQYAAVARPDKPGVLTVGFSAERLALFRSLAGLDGIAKEASDANGDAFVEITPLAAGQSLPQGYFTADRQGVRHMCLATTCEDRLVTVGLPDPAGLLTSPVVSGALVLLAFLLLVGVCGALAPDAVAASWSSLKTFGLFFWGLHAEKAGLKIGKRRMSLRKLLTNPIVLAWLAAYVLCAVFIWSIRTKEARDAARELLQERSANAVSDVSGSVDNMLFAIARAMVRHYRTPDSFTSRDAADLARRYDVDEVSVVNAKGVAFVTNFGNENFEMASCAESAKFNCLLHGVAAYAQPFRAAVDDGVTVRKYAGVPFPDAPGYVQIGIDRSRLTSDLRYLFEDNVRARKLGKGGFLLWVDDRTGEIVANGAEECRPDDTLAGIGFSSVTAPAEGTPFRTEFYGRPCLVVWRRYANLRLYAARPCDEISALGKSIPPWIVMTLMVIGFVKLSTRLSDLVAQLKSFIVAEQERQRSDMTMARTIQTSALPVGFPNEGDFRIFAKMTAAREVGGDFYDFCTLSDGRILFLIADVSGKGVPAALFMMRAKATLQSAVVECGGSLADAVRQANDSLSEHNDAEMFVTAWIGIFDRRTGEIEYVSAGHNPPLVKRADGSVEWLRARGGMVLAAMCGVKYRASACRLGKGDSIFLYTDGVTEAIDTKDEQYGEARLEAALRRSGKDFVTEISEDLAAFTAGADQFDDITMLALDVPAADERGRKS